MTTAAWIHGQPDPRCAICRGLGEARVRKVRPIRGVRAAVIVVRLVPTTVGCGIEDDGAPRSDDRMVLCPSCMVTDAGWAIDLEGSVFVVKSTRGKG